VVHMRLREGEGVVGPVREPIYPDFQLGLPAIYCFDWLIGWSVQYSSSRELLSELIRPAK